MTDALEPDASESEVPGGSETFDRVVALVPDLMDRSKVAAASIRPIEFVSSAAGMLGKLAGPADGTTSDRIDLVVLDLSRAGALDLIPAAAATGARVIAFGSHVDHEVLDAARAAGCDQVLPRSIFFGRLTQLIGH